MLLDSWASRLDSIGPAARVCGDPELRNVAVEHGGQEKAVRVHGGLKREAEVHVGLEKVARACTWEKTVVEIRKGLERSSLSQLMIPEFWRIAGVWFLSRGLKRQLNEG